MINEDPKLLALIEYQTPTSSLKSDISELPTPEPHYFPMASASTDVQDQIWLRILKFTLEIPLEITMDLLQKLARTRWSLPLVSKQFQVSLYIYLLVNMLKLHQRLATPLLYHSPVMLCETNNFCKSIDGQTVPCRSHPLPRFLEPDFLRFSLRLRHAEDFSPDIWSHRSRQPSATL
jgi:hypothetical protein